LKAKQNTLDHRTIITDSSNDNRFIGVVSMKYKTNKKQSAICKKLALQVYAQATKTYRKWFGTN